MTTRLKQAIRQSCRRIREKLPLSYQQQASAQICSRIRQLEQYRYAKHIALYRACNGEVDLNELWQAASPQGKYCYFPRLNANKQLSFLPVTPTTAFINNRFAIPEPDIDESYAVAPNNLDIIFMPLVAFDEHGTRLGMGGGYYDRTLAHQHHALLVGVAYDFQRQSYLVPEEWDIPLTCIITPKKTYWSKP